MVNNMFDTHAIRFNNRETFNLAVAILEQSDLNDFFNDIGHSDMNITFDNKSVLNNFISELAIHHIQKPVDFTI